MKRRHRDEIIFITLVWLLTFITDRNLSRWENLIPAHRADLVSPVLI